MLVSWPRRLGTCPWGHRLTGPCGGGRASCPPIRPRFIPGSPPSCPPIHRDPSTGFAAVIHRVVPRCGWKRGGSWTEGDGARVSIGAVNAARALTPAPAVTPISTQRDGAAADVDHSDARRCAERPLPDAERGAWERHAHVATPDSKEIDVRRRRSRRERRAAGAAGVPDPRGGSSRRRRAALRADVRVGAPRPRPGAAGDRCSAVRSGVGGVDRRGRAPSARPARGGDRRSGGGCGHRWPHRQPDSRSPVRSSRIRAAAPARRRRPGCAAPGADGVSAGRAA